MKGVLKGQQPKKNNRGSINPSGQGPNKTVVYKNNELN